MSQLGRILRVMAAFCVIHNSASTIALSAEPLQIQPIKDRASIEIRHPEILGAVFELRIPEHVDTLEGLVPQQVSWERVNDHHWRFRWEAEQALKAEKQTDFWGEVKGGSDEVAFTIKMHNPDARAWNHERYNACDLLAGRAEMFHDLQGERTVVWVSDRAVSLREALQGQFSPELTGWMTFAADVNEPKFREYTERLMARSSVDGRWTIGIASDTAQGVTFNLQPHTSCLHQNRTWRRLQPDETATLRGKVYVVRGSVDDLWRRYLPDRERWKDLQLQNEMSLALNSPTNVVVGYVSDQATFAVQGGDAAPGSEGAAVEVLRSDGNLLWRATAGRGTTVGAYLQWIDGPDQQPFVLYSFVPADQQAPGEAHLLDATSGQVRNRIQNVTHFGNNNSLFGDFDADGVNELIYADQRTLTCYDLLTFRPKWRFDDGVLFCWSLPALQDLDRDHKPEIVFGSEYNNGGGDSSLLAISSDGQLLWRSDGHEEDLGSTPVFSVDVDGDGTLELVKVGLDLEHRRNLEWNHIHVFDVNGKLIRKIPFGCTGIAIGDLDDDGHLEGVGLTNLRDGGRQGQAAIRCVDLATGELRWTTDVPRAHLDCNSPQMLDVDGDGRLEAIVGTGNPSGYARLPQSKPWGDLYVVDADGAIRQHLSLKGWPVNLAQCDIDGDQRSELMVVVDGQPGWLHVYDTHEPTGYRDWPTPFGNASRWRQPTAAD